MLEQPTMAPSLLKKVQSLQDRVPRYTIDLEANTQIHSVNKRTVSMVVKKRVGAEETLARYIGVPAFIIVMLVWFFGFGVLGSVGVGAVPEIGRAHV